MMIVTHPDQRTKKCATLPGCLSAYNEQLAAASRLEDTVVDFMHVVGSGRIAVHQGQRSQICAVVQGSGWFRGAEPDWVELQVGDLVSWEAGETRSWRTDYGLLLLSVRARGEFRSAGLTSRS